MCTMRIMRFDWDEKKSQTNKNKHDTSFEEAQTVFFDPLAQMSTDHTDSTGETRSLLIWHSGLHNLLLIVHCFSDQDKSIRIISARKATRSERKQYEEGL